MAGGSEAGRVARRCCAAIQGEEDAGNGQQRFIEISIAANERAQANQPVHFLFECQRLKCVLAGPLRVPLISLGASACGNWFVDMEFLHRKDAENDEKYEQS